MKRTIICGLLFLLLHFQQAFAQQAADFEWRVGSLQEARITGYTGSRTAVTIPNELDGFSVTAIGNNVFANKGLSGIVIPDGVTSIGSYAFINNRLTSVNLPERLGFIGAGTFANNRLTSVAISNGLGIIGSGAFARNQLTSISIPDSVFNIGDAAFAHNRLTGVVIPSRVSEIHHSAFAGNPLVSITIGANVNLRWEAFGDCGFDRAYTDGGRLAGTYTRTNTESTVWTLEE